ncbi:hypothetical protein [Micropruina sp.]|uniref:hypothetical protein n=1 Tax=Micropruina sp. TaxID=2737536 RepID=UPI00260929E8|nr:hypothetical protein [Micropruina sp.]
MLGIVVGLVVLFGGGWLFFALAEYMRGEAANFVGLALPLLYLGGSIALAVRDDTRRFGSGLLLAIGAALIILAGVCFGLLFMLAGHG